MQSPPNTFEREVSLPLPPTAFLAGDVVAEKYRLEREIGEGGMGTVWVATNTTLETPVALKILRGTGIVGASERMLREARAVASLRHPAIVRVFDFGVAPGHQAYIVMELLEGESLASLLGRSGRLPPERAVQLLLPVAEGLAAAHAHRIVHRDLKPDNIFLATDDSGRRQPKIVDFGVAKLLHPSSGPGVTGVSLIGTPHYMSPEQAIGDDVDERADVWALSAVLHELITDEYVFDGADVEQVLRAVVDTPAASLVEKAGVDEALWSIVERGLRKRRDERWSSALEMARALATWLLDQGVEEDATGASIRRNWLELPTPPRPTPRRTPATVAGMGPADPHMPQEDPSPFAPTCLPSAGGASVRSLSARLSLIRGRTARVTAILAAAAALMAVWVLLRSNAVAEEAVVRGLAVAPRDDIAQTVVADTRSLDMSEPTIRAEAASTTSPSPASTASPSTSSARRPAAGAAPPRRSSAETVDFGF